MTPPSRSPAPRTLAISFTALITLALAAQTTTIGADS
jgi:hypothetical protein